MNATVTEEEVHGQLVDWCEAVTGLTVVRAFPGVDRPAGAYLLTNLLNGPTDVRDFPAGFEYAGTGENNDQGNEQIEITPVIETEWEFSISSYGGENVMDPIRKLRSVAEVEGPQQGISHMLTVFNFGRPNHVPEQINHEWEPRAHVRVFIRGYTRDGFLIDVIDQAPITATRT